MKTGRVKKLSVALVLIAGLCGLSANAASAAAIKCSYAQAGPAGLAGNRLDIRVGRAEEATAVYVNPGGGIRVIDDKRMHALRCAGRKPSVTNIDRISYKAKRSAGSTYFTVAQPLNFAPGTRSYESGGSGISFRVSGKAIIFGEVGGDEADVVTAGMIHGVVGMDFGPEPAISDVDLRIRAKYTTLDNVLGGGNDQFFGDGRGGLFDAPLRTASASVYGEGGNDEIVGGNGQDVLDGGNGADSLLGKGGADILTGGPGIDVFDGAGGNDEIDAADRRPENVECGRGRDHAEIDLKDSDSNCETFLYP